MVPANLQSCEKLKAKKTVNRLRGKTGIIKDFLNIQAVLQVHTKPAGEIY